MTRSHFTPAPTRAQPSGCTVDLVEALGDDEQVAGERALGAVAGGLHADGEAVGAGEADGRGDVLGGA